MITDERCDSQRKKQEDAEFLHNLYEKYYGNQKDKKEVYMAMNGPSRKELMEQAKQRCIKNFRVMNREELKIVLDDPLKIPEIQQKAVTRWKSGWSKNKKLQEASHGTDK